MVCPMRDETKEGSLVDQKLPVGPEPVDQMGWACMPFRRTLGQHIC